ncbi:MAG TPA: hypothetical protein VH619_13350 [Verrucomicrobiae bacterium]|nr:hypothetical protein [Verrucomicrobiae bacterium]
MIALLAVANPKALIIQFRLSHFFTIETSGEDKSFEKKWKRKGEGAELADFGLSAIGNGHHEVMGKVTKND